jgi:hypothetical protein
MLAWVDSVYSFVSGWKAVLVTDGRGTGMEFREPAAGVDGNSGAGTGLDGTAMQWRGTAQWKT